MHFFGSWQGFLPLLVCCGFLFDSVIVTCPFTDETDGGDICVCSLLSHIKLLLAWLLWPSRFLLQQGINSPHLFFIGIACLLNAFISYIIVALADVYGMYLASNKMNSRPGWSFCERLGVVSGPGVLHISSLSHVAFRDKEISCAKELMWSRGRCFICY